MLTSPSTIVPPALDSKPLRAFSPVMAGVIQQFSKGNIYEKEG